MKLHCATCGATIPAEDVNLDTGLARCRPCDEVFDVKALQAYQEEARPREPVPMPRGYSVVDDINGMIITRRWFNWGIIALLIFCCFWDGFLVVWYTIAFTEDSPLIMKIFPIGHLAVGAALTYCVIAGLFNRTKIDVDYDRVIVRHGPIPCFGNKRVDAVNVQQAYVKRSSYQVNNRHRWNVMIETADRSRSLKLVGGLHEEEQAQFIEQELERFLGIEDRAGELMPGPGITSPVAQAAS